jgi:hypothetical protein
MLSFSYSFLLLPKISFSSLLNHLEFDWIIVTRSLFSAWITSSSVV